MIRRIGRKIVKIKIRYMLIPTNNKTKINIPH